MFLVLRLVAAALDFSGIAGTATQISRVLFVVGIVFLVIHGVQGGVRQEGPRENVL